MKLDLILSWVVIVIGLYGLATSKSIIKSIISLNIMQAAVILTYLSFGNRSNGHAPIITRGIKNMVDPLPQALMITNIVIGAAITAVALMLTIKIFHYYGTLNWKELMEREG